MGELKRGWKRVKFGDLVHHVSERVDPNVEDNATYVGLEHLDSGSLTVTRWGSPTELIGTKLRMRKGDILFARRNAYLRRVALAPHDGLFSAHGMVLRAKPPHVVPEFLPFFIQSDVFMDRAEKISVGSLSPTINWSTLKEEEFALPPLEEQRRIADLLILAETARSTFASALELAQTCFDAALRDLFPETSDFKPLQEIASISSGGTPDRSVPSYWGGDIPWVKTGEVRWQLIRSTEESITEAGLQKSAAKLLPAGTILLAMYGQGPTLGRAGTLAISAATNQACAAIQVSDRHDANFVYYWLMRQYEAIRGSARGATQPNLNLAIVKSIKVPNVERTEETRIAEQLRDAESVIELIRQRSQVVSGLVHSMQTLLSEK